MSSTENALALTRRSLARLLEISPDSITLQTRLVEDLGVDSIGYIQLADLLEFDLEQQGVSASVADDALLRFATVADVVEHVQGLSA